MVHIQLVVKSRQDGNKNAMVHIKLQRVNHEGNKLKSFACI